MIQVENKRKTIHLGNIRKGAKIQILSRFSPQICQQPRQDFDREQDVHLTRNISVEDLLRERNSESIA